MITFLHGKLVDALPTQVTIDVHGVGYEALIPLSSFDKLPPAGSDVHLLTHLAIREDAHVLFGFITRHERDLFRLLIHTVSGIGPKIALNILSGMSVAAFSAAVTSNDVRSLSQITGVGRKTAERIVVELKDKLGAAGATPASATPTQPQGHEAVLQDAVKALVALGFKPNDAHETLRPLQAMLGPSATVEELVRRSLRKGASPRAESED